MLDPLDFPQRTDIGSIDDALDAINRNYNPSLCNEYFNNCWSCADAYELQRRGYDMDSIPSWGTSEAEIAQDWQRRGLFSSSDMPINSTSGSGYEDICSSMAAFGEGSRAQVLVTWADEYGNPDGGHAFVCEQEGGITRFLDPQNHSRDASAYFQDVVPGTTRFFRTDNVDLDRHALSGCVRPL